MHLPRALASCFFSFCRWYPIVWPEWRGNQPGFY
jgi:hypothetical protein